MRFFEAETDLPFEPRLNLVYDLSSKAMSIFIHTIHVTVTLCNSILDKLQLLNNFWRTLKSIVMSGVWISMHLYLNKLWIQCIVSDSVKQDDSQTGSSKLKFFHLVGILVKLLGGYCFQSYKTRLECGDTHKPEKDQQNEDLRSLVIYNNEQKTHISSILKLYKHMCFRLLCHIAWQRFWQINPIYSCFYGNADCHRIIKVVQYLFSLFG